MQANYVRKQIEQALGKAAKSFGGRILRFASFQKDLLRIYLAF